MRRLVLTTALLSVGLAGTALPAEARQVPDRDGPVTTSEQECFEHTTLKGALAGPVLARLPEGWTAPMSVPGRTLVRFVDYTCEDWTIEGSPSRRTSTTMLVVEAHRVDDPGVKRRQVIEHGTDNPHYVHALRRLGVASHLLPESAATLVEKADGSYEYVQSFLGADEGPDLDHTRTATAPALGEQVTDTEEYWLSGSAGDVRVSYANDYALSVQAWMAEETMGEASRLRLEYGLTSPRGFTGPNVRFTRGGWTSVITPQ